MHFELSKEFLNSIEEGIKNDRESDIVDMVIDLHPADIADIINHLKLEDAKLFYQYLDAEKAANALMELEEEKSLDFSYRLEVSSPGVGFPLKLHRQYVSNIGRHLKIVLVNQEEISGKLLKVEEEEILLELLPTAPKGKKKSRKPKTAGPEKQIKFSDIKESKVIIV